MKVRILAFGIIAFLYLFIIGNANAIPTTVQYIYYNWYDNPLEYQILKGDFIENGGSIVSILQQEGEWWFRGTPPTGGSSQDHAFRDRLVVTVENNRPWHEDSYTYNTHYGFTIGIWDSVTLKYIEDMRDPVFDYDGDGTGSNWYPSSVDAHSNPTWYVSFINYQNGYAPWDREFFELG